METAIAAFEPVGVLEIAKIFGVTTDAVGQWQRRYKASRNPFPQARGKVSGFAAWDRDEVLKWGRETNRLNGERRGSRKPEAS